MVKALVPGMNSLAGFMYIVTLHCGLGLGWLVRYLVCVDLLISLLINKINLFMISFNTFTLHVFSYSMKCMIER